jgi:hypothetical protein
MWPLKKIVEEETDVLRKVSAAKALKTLSRRSNRVGVGKGKQQGLLRK